MLVFDPVGESIEDEVAIGDLEDSPNLAKVVEVKILVLKTSTKNLTLSMIIVLIRELLIISKCL